jgi:uncharacterized sulfatase
MLLRTLVLFAFTASALAEGLRPNILFILADDHAPWAMKNARDPNAFTPHMDRLAREGTRFTHAFTPTPVCSPARASLLTSRYGSELGITDWLNSKVDKAVGLPEHTPTWPELLAGAGYQTALFGKWHVGDQPRQRPTSRGYGHFMGFIGGGVATLDPTLEQEGVTAKRDGYTVDLVSEAAMEWLRARDPKKPFAVSLHFREPHTAYLPVRPEDWDRVKDVDIRLPQPIYPGTDTESVTKKTREYLASIAAVDRNVGRILDTLDALGLSENTLVVYTSDHGYNVGHHGIWHKGNGHWILLPEAVPPGTENIPAGQRPNMFDTSLKVPMLVRWPGRVPAGAENPHFISHLDWLPTFAELGTGAVPKDVVYRGKSIVPLLANPPVSGAEPGFFAEYSTKHQSSTHMRAYRTTDWKLVRDFKNPGRDELYHLATDPGELENLIPSKDPAAEAARSRLEAAILERMREIGDPLAQPANR